MRKMLLKAAYYASPVYSTFVIGFLDSTFNINRPSLYTDDISVAFSFPKVTLLFERLSIVSFIPS